MKIPYCSDCSVLLQDVDRLEIELRRMDAKLEYMQKANDKLEDLLAAAEEERDRYKKALAGDIVYLSKRRT